MTAAEVEEFLEEPHVAVLSVSRRERGPIAVPMWYEYREGQVWMITFTGSVHGRAMQQTGRATITIHSEAYGDTQTVERYVIAEGPIAFTDDDIEPLVRRIRRRYYTGPHADEWVNRPLDPSTLRQSVTALKPEALSGHQWVEQL